jgi:excisionase family DNA binding protein
MDALMTTAEAAALLGVTDSRVRQYIMDGRLREARRIGGAIMLERRDVEALVRLPRGRPRTAPKGATDDRIA